MINKIWLLVMTRLPFEPGALCIFEVGAQQVNTVGFIMLHRAGDSYKAYAGTGRVALTPTLRSQLTQ